MYDIIVNEYEFQQHKYFMAWLVEVRGCFLFINHNDICEEPRVTKNRITDNDIGEDSGIEIYRSLKKQYAAFKEARGEGDVLSAMLADKHFTPILS